jgi:hypothetical protein
LKGVGAEGVERPGRVLIDGKRDRLVTALVRDSPIRFSERPLNATIGGPERFGRGADRRRNLGDNLPPIALAMCFFLRRPSHV